MGPVRDLVAAVPAWVRRRPSPTRYWSGAGGRASAAPGDHLGRPRRPARGVRDRARPHLHLGDPRLRHLRPLPHRPAPGRRPGLRSARLRSAPARPAGPARRVFNHVSRRHPLAQAALRDGPDSDAATWFRTTAGPPDQVQLATFEGHEQLVVLNHDNPEVAEHVVRVMRHWLERGADAWRLDAAYAVPTRFWAEVLPQVRANHPDVWFEAEVLHGDYATFAHDSTADAVTQRYFERPGPPSPSARPAGIAHQQLATTRSLSDVVPRH